MLFCSLPVARSANWLRQAVIATATCSLAAHRLPLRLELTKLAEAPGLRAHGYCASLTAAALLGLRRKCAVPALGGLQFAGLPVWAKAVKLVVIKFLRFQAS